jgi:hypothetical protein
MVLATNQNLLSRPQVVAKAGQGCEYEGWCIHESMPSVDRLLGRLVDHSRKYAGGMSGKGVEPFCMSCPPFGFEAIDDAQRCRERAGLRRADAVSVAEKPSLLACFPRKVVVNAAKRPIDGGLPRRPPVAQGREPRPFRLGRVRRIPVLFEVLVIGAAAQKEAVPAFDKDHLIAAVPADLAPELDAGAQEGGPLRHPFLFVFLGFLIEGPLLAPDDMLPEALRHIPRRGLVVDREHLPHARVAEEGFPVVGVRVRQSGSGSARSATA